MPEKHRYLPEAEQRLGRQPTSSDDVVVMVSDVIYDTSLEPEEALARITEILEGPFALEVYENEMQRREPRDANRWH